MVSDNTNEVLWTTVLDPKCQSMKHLSSREQDFAKAELIDQVLHVTSIQNRDGASGTATYGHGNDGQKAMALVDTLDIFDLPAPSMFPEYNNEYGSGDFEADCQIHLQSAKREVENYLDLQTIVVRPEADSLIWWKDHKIQFP
jgi:hypothetical protein